MAYSSTCEMEHGRTTPLSVCRRHGESGRAVNHPESAALGLTSVQVAERVARGDTNEVHESSSRPLRDIVIANVVTRFNAILGVLFVVVVVAGSPVDALFGLVLVVNSLVGIAQEFLAKRKLDRLSFLAAPKATVVRDGAELDVPTAAVVLDDLVELHAGDRVPADGRVVESDGLEVNQSNLTGESDPVHKAVGDDVMSSTIVTAGSGRFVATAVGARSHIHRLAAEAKVFTRTSSEIQGSTNRLLGYITWAIVIVAPLQVWSQFNVMGADNWREALVRSSSGIVGMVPEGLVLLTTLAFLSAAVRLARQQVLIQELPAVEGLARVSIVCLDKTGTITTGRIIFESLDVVDAVRTDGEVRAALATLASGETTGTLVAIAEEVAGTMGWDVESSVPFSSARKWSAVHSVGRGSWVLGAPEVLLAAGHPILARVNDLADAGKRVLLVATSAAALSGVQLPSPLHPVAILVFAEEIRPDAAVTLGYFADQGIAVKIISGDNQRTVSAIARRVGLEVGEGVDARAMGETTDDVRPHAGAVVFGRVTPEQKRSLVRALQESGEVVAMTGDGVNDVLALKQADIGIAMNNGAPATKSVAQMVLLDGRFERLPPVLREGRRVIGNVERVANLFVAKNAMSLMAILTAAVLSLPFPLLPRHMTLLSTVTIGVPSFFLALAPNTRRYRPGFLRRVLRFALPAGAVAGVVVALSDFWARGQYGTSDGVKCSVINVSQNAANEECWRVGSAAAASVILVFLWILVVLSRPMNRWKVLTIVAMASVAVVAFSLPMMRGLFSFSLPLELAAQSLLLGGAGAFIVEFLHRRSQET